MAAKCGKCDACELERIGCGCDGALDDGCFLCRPLKHTRPACYVSDPLPERVPRSDDCPHCHKSMWMGRNNDRGCQCKMPAVVHTAPFEGDVEIVLPSLGRPGHFDLVKRRHVEVKVKMDRRVDLFHFITGLRFHLRAAEETLAKMDGETGSPEQQRMQRHFQGGN